MNPRTTARRSAVAAAVLALCGCQQRMAREGRVRDFAPSPVFADGGSAQAPVAGTIARGQLRTDTALFQGRKNGAWIRQIPIPLTRALLERGRERFEIHCAPCHNATGDGQGMIVRRGLSAPPSYHIDRLRNAPAGHFFDVITHGYGAMFSFADRIEPADRWAIVAYIRALQLSQHARYDELPPALRARVDAEAHR